MPTDADGSGAATSRMVIVVGPGRSGTSTVAGALARAGFEVPAKAIRSNPTNPSGFYEPRWVVDFHKDLLKRHQVDTMDSSPQALEIMSRVTARPKVRETLRSWLATRLAEQPRLVVKDPRSIWFCDLWVEVARGLGVEPGFVTMLRHPAEVSASRHKYYRSGDRPATRNDEIVRVSGWVNGVLSAELMTRGSPRSFIRYTDLLEDWRSVLEPLEGTLGLQYDPALDVSPHPIDDFIDPSLHRVNVSWADVDVPAPLRDLGERVWQSFSTMASGGESDALRAEADALRGEYRRMTDDAQALNRSMTRRASAQARRKGRRQALKERPAGEHVEDVGKARLSAKALWRRLAARSS